MELKQNQYRNGYFKVAHEFVEKYWRYLGPAAGSVYLVFKSHAQGKHYAFPSEELVAQELGVHPRTVLRAIKTLEKFNVIKKEKRRGPDGKWLKNYYLLNPYKIWAFPTDKLSPGGNRLKIKKPPDNLYQNQVTKSHSNKNNLIRRNNILLDSKTGLKRINSPWKE